MNQKTIPMLDGKIPDRHFPLGNGQMLFDDKTKKTLTHYDGILYDAIGTVVIDLSQGGFNA